MGTNWSSLLADSWAFSYILGEVVLLLSVLASLYCRVFPTVIPEYSKTRTHAGNDANRFHFHFLAWLQARESETEGVSDGWSVGSSAWIILSSSWCRSCRGERGAGEGGIARRTAQDGGQHAPEGREIYTKKPKQTMHYLVSFQFSYLHMVCTGFLALI